MLPSTARRAGATPALFCVSVYDVWHRTSSGGGVIRFTAPSGWPTSPAARRSDGRVGGDWGRTLSERAGGGGGGEPATPVLLLVPASVHFHCG